MSSKAYSHYWVAVGVWDFLPGWSVVDAFNLETGLGHWSGKSEAELREEYGASLRLMTTEQADELLFHQARQPLRRESEEAFEEALNCLPPMAWHSEPGWESFASSEYDSGRVTAIHIRTGEGCFRLHDDSALAFDWPRLQAAFKEWMREGVAL